MSPPDWLFLVRLMVNQSHKSGVVECPSMNLWTWTRVEVWRSIVWVTTSSHHRHDHHHVWINRRDYSVPHRDNHVTRSTSPSKEVQRVTSPSISIIRLVSRLHTHWWLATNHCNRVPAYHVELGSSHSLLWPFCAVQSIIASLWPQMS